MSGKRPDIDLDRMKRCTQEANEERRKYYLTFTNCERCGSQVVNGYCRDQTCPFSNHFQYYSSGWSGHPEKDLFVDQDGRSTCENCSCQ